MSLIITEMQIKTTMRYHFTPVRWPSSMNQQTSAGEDVEKGESLYIVGGNADWYSTLESSMEIPQKFTNGSAFWLSDPTSRNRAEGTQNSNSKEHKHPYVHRSIVYNRQEMEAAQVSINRCVHKTTMGLVGVAQRIECWPVNQKVTGLISNQDTCLGCRPGPQ